MKPTDFVMDRVVGARTIRFRLQAGDRPVVEVWDRERGGAEHGWLIECWPLIDWPGGAEDLEIDGMYLSSVTVSAVGSWARQTMRAVGLS